MQNARELLSHSLLHGSWDKVLESLCDRLIAQKTKLRGDRRGGFKETTTCDRNLNTPATTYKVQNRVSTNLKKAILSRDQCCQWKDPRTGKQCASSWQLQVDHRRPQWTRGLHKAGNLHQDQNLHQAENLQILCGQHNRLKYQQEARIRRKVIRPLGIDPCSG